MSKPSPLNRTYYASTVTALLIWSTSFIATKAAYATFPPITLGAARFVIATAVLGIFLLLLKERTLPAPKHLALMALSGSLGITLYFMMENIGVSLTSASNAALIVASYPAVTALLEWLLYRTKLSASKMLGIALAMIGVYVLSQTGGAEEGGSHIVGNVILIGTGFVWAFYNFTTRKIVNQYPAITLSFYQTAAGTLLFLPFVWIERNAWQPPTLATWSLLLYLGVICSVVAFMLYNFGLRKLSASVSVSLMNLVPIFGVLFSILFLRETVSWLQAAGGLVVIVGVLLSAAQPTSK
ncbi:DMT family transporter [Paenibacillus hodogayensis]|uniref:DMT family transporter n=1 Tax=Paenibacillus hodogayensis TaxID=279208 RepID=A0ABV5W017_9BACL